MNITRLVYSVSDMTENRFSAFRCTLMDLTFADNFRASASAVLCSCSDCGIDNWIRRCRVGRDLGW